MIAYEPSAWSDLFVAAAGATAALSGLVFVAVSINVDRVLKFEGIPELAMMTLLMLLGILIVSLIGLIPEQSGETLGIEYVAVMVPLVGLGARLASRSIPRGGEEPTHLSSRVVLPLIGVLPLAIGAVTLVLGSGGGLYWIVAGMILTTCAAIANAWILLIEILR